MRPIKWRIRKTSNSRWTLYSYSSLRGYVCVASFESHSLAIRWLNDWYR